MASFGATASASAAVANNVPKSSTYLPFCHRHFHYSDSKVAFRINSKPKLRLVAKGIQSNLNRSVVARAQLNEVAVDGPSNAAATASSESETDAAATASSESETDAAATASSEAETDAAATALSESETDAAATALSESETDAAATALSESETDAAATALSESETDAAATALSESETDAAATASSESEIETNDLKLSNEPEPLGSEETISAFISQVSDLVKLVDSRDIVELQLKQLDCELLIRKKDALAPPPSAAPVMYAPAHHVQQPMAPSPPPAPVPASASGAAAPPPPKTALVPVAKSAKSSHPPLKSPMAGTFYRSPGPGEPPYVKVGDNVQRGQVLCIVEAMKLMNEIEADRTGKIVEILVEDGKGVTFDTPLFVIEPQ